MIGFLVTRNPLPLLQLNHQHNHKSCEMIADDLAEQIAARFPGRQLTITVSEDGEVGSTTEYQT